MHNAESERWEETKTHGKDKLAGNLTRGVGPSSRVSEGFVQPPDWTTEDGGTVLTSKVRLKYRSHTGQYFSTLAAVQEFLV